MQHKATSQEVTLENWQFALAPLSEDEQGKITTALAGISKFADHVKVDEKIGEMDFVAACFAEIILQDSERKELLKKLFNHALARSLNKSADESADDKEEVEELKDAIQVGDIVKHNTKG